MITHAIGFVYYKVYNMFQVLLSLVEVTKACPVSDFKT